MEKMLQVIVANCPQDHCIRGGKCSDFCPKKALVLQ